MREWRALFRRKSFDELRSDAAQSQLRRTLTRTDLSVLGVGAVIGSGIFVLPGIVAESVAGPAVVISLLIAGVAAMLAALCYAEFASVTPVSGSAYTYAYATLGELPAWIIGWGLILEYTLGSALLAIGWGAYVTGFLFRNLHLHVYSDTYLHLAAAIAVALSTAVVCAGIRISAYATTVFVLIKLAVILLFIFFGMTFVDPVNWHPFVPTSSGVAGKFGWSGVFRGASIMFVAYIGFDAVTTAAQEARDPQRDVPAGVLISLGVSAVLYALLALVLTGLVRYDKLSVSNPVAEAIRVTGVKWVSVAVELGAIAGLSSVLLVLLLGQARIMLAMSRDRLLPSVFGIVSEKTGVPIYATLITGAAAFALTLFASLQPISELVSIGTFLAFTIVCIGIPILRRTDPDLPRRFRVPGSPWLPLIGAAACCYLVSALPSQTWLLAALWFAIGLVVYAVGWFRRR